MGLEEIIVTAQRQAQSLQAVPIAVSAFSAENLEKQQIQNSSDLQLSLPNVTFTKTNFTSSSFTIRGIGDLCVGVSCDSATGIHLNDMPMTQSRLFETEFFDLERIEVLRGPQGTLFGRNATSGVVNVITAKPDLSGFGASGEADYGKFNSVRVKGMLNVPLGETLGIRLAGMYNRRDGYTYNIGTDSRIDGRDMYALRGSLRWEPSADTTIDISGYYFRESDSRSRVQKQLCHRDPTGVLGCLPDKLANETTNGDSTLASLLSSREFFGIAASPTLAPLGLGSIYGTDGDGFANAVNPANVRTVNVDYLPTYFAKEEVYQAKLQQAVGEHLTLNVTAGYARNEVRSRTDYNLATQRAISGSPGLFALAAFAANPATAFAFAPIAARLIPNGPTGNVCQSDIDPNNVGVFGAGGKTLCGKTSYDIDESSQSYKQYAAEAHLDSDFDGMLNFLIGANYLRGETTNNSYYVNSFGLDYASGVLGAAAALTGATGGKAVFRPSPFFRSNTDKGILDSYGIFGESYFQFNDKVKLTLGLRYNHDKKFTRARTTLLSNGLSSEFASGGPLYALIGANTLEEALNYASAGDFDKGTTGVQPFQERSVSFGRMTGRAVLDYQITPDNLVYLSYSRGYKSGGINPPLSVGSVNDSFKPESVDAFEFGSKNRFGALQLNLSAFYYRYKDLQLSRITARTSVNDNINANIYGVEAEAIMAPTRNLLVNLSASYLKTKVAGDQFFVDTRDVSAGRSDTVIIKDITLGSNCAVTGASAAAANAFVGAINGKIGLKAPTPIPGTNTTGAFSICGALATQAAAIGNLFGGIRVSSGIEKNVKGNQLPQAPEFKWSAGIQYTIEAGEMSLVPRFDINYTGESYGTIFNGNINRIKGFAVMNAQVQLNGRDDRWFLRGYIQNIANNNATTGLYVTDQSSGLFTNIFTLEPRRYGVAAGFKF
ncbi:TonB-dependent receptor [Novosphingobium sp. MMS21-SN21R]|nr:TonB-dependent receptor [Novosphingobium sp. MMS21-SN21R]MDT0507858.1 TonB-dependent receptor [Novosphingobium sp. MMS21-SN21R]